MLETSRLVLRQWEAKDRAPFAALNADPDVMRFFPTPLQRTESDNPLQGSRKALQSAVGDSGSLNLKKHTSLWVCRFTSTA